MPNQNGRLSRHAVIWDGVGMRSIADYLQAQGVDLQGARLESAVRVATRDGTSVVQGVTSVPQGTGAWIAWLPVSD